MRSCWEPSLKASLIAFSSASACFLYPHPPHHWQLMTTLSFFASAIVELVVRGGKKKKRFFVIIKLVFESRLAQLNSRIQVPLVQ